MRHLKYILILAFSFICYACVENDPEILSTRLSVIIKLIIW